MSQCFLVVLKMLQLLQVLQLQIDVFALFVTTISHKLREDGELVVKAVNGKPLFSPLLEGKHDESGKNEWANFVAAAAARSKFYVGSKRCYRVRFPLDTWKSLKKSTIEKCHIFPIFPVSCNDYQDISPFGCQCLSPFEGRLSSVSSLSSGFVSAIKESPLVTSGWGLLTSTDGGKDSHPKFILEQKFLCVN